MIVGHWGIAYAVSAKTRDAPFLLFAVASIAPDCLDVVYAIAGVCSPYGVYSHSLPALLPLAAVAAVAIWLLTRNWRFGLVGMALVLIHLPADWVTGRKALFLAGPLAGANLYSWPIVDFLLEVPLLVAGWLAARRAETRPRWAVAIPTLLILVTIQGAGNVMRFLNLENPVSSQNPACRDTWRH